MGRGGHKKFPPPYTNALVHPAYRHNLDSFRAFLAITLYFYFRIVKKMNKRIQDEVAEL